LKYAIPRASREWLFRWNGMTIFHQMSIVRYTQFRMARLMRLVAWCGLSLVLTAPAGALAEALPLTGSEPSAEDTQTLPEGTPATTDAVSASDVNRFDVLEYRVEGNSTLARERIEEAVYPFLGEKKTIDDVQQARAALEEAYQSAGYLTVFVALPEQQVEHGVVRLAVTEGKIERLKVSGSRYYSLGAIKAGAAELEEGMVPNFNTVQKELVGLNRNAGRKVTPLLRSGRIPGTIEAELKVDDQLPLHATVELNDRYSRDTSKTRLSAAVRYDNLWQEGHSLNLNVQMAPEVPEESRVLVATYVAPLASGNTLALYGVKSDTDVTTVGGINSLGKGVILGLRYILPLRPLPGVFHSLSLGMDYKDYQDSVLFGSSQDSNMPITYLPFTLGYDLSLVGKKDQTRIGLSTVFSLRDVVSDSAEFDAKRPGARANFAYLKADVRHQHAFDSGFILAENVSVQFTDSLLISNEQMAAGGADTVRGYPESAALGDRGWRVGLELSSPSLAGTWAPGLNELRLLGFAEAARLDFLEAAALQQSRFELASVGLGLRFRAAKRVSGALDYAWPLEDAGGVEAGDGRVHFRLGAEW
jgi:hemolysin activation/secretion protein